MSSEGRTEASELAVQKYREASLWRVGLNKSVHEWRCLAVYYLTVKSLVMMHKEARGSAPLHMVEELAKAHDMLILTRENISSLSRAADACEMSGRIYEEEEEGLEYWRRNGGNWGEPYGDDRD